MKISTFVARIIKREDRLNVLKKNKSKLLYNNSNPYERLAKIEAKPLGGRIEWIHRSIHSLDE